MRVIPEPIFPTLFKLMTETEDNRNQYLANPRGVCLELVIGFRPFELHFGNSESSKQRYFNDIQTYVSQTVTKIARNSCKRACNELCRKFHVPENRMFDVEVMVHIRGGGPRGDHFR